MGVPIVHPRKLSNVFEIIPEPRFDEPGYRVLLFDQKTFAGFGFDLPWVQDFVVHTTAKHTLRGLHVSLYPFFEAKIITAVRGEALWVAVDLRTKSPTFDWWESVLLSEKTHNLLCVGRGFAHGCISRTDDCDLLIKTDNVPSDDFWDCISWDDPTLGIDWQLKGVSPIVTEKYRQRRQSFDGFLKKYGGL